MPSITVSNLSWSTPNGQSVLSELELTFGSERTALVGRNGVGKSTLLKIISGEIAPSSGQARVAGTLGILRQSTQPDPELSIADLFGVADEIQVLKKADAGQSSAGELALVDWTLLDRVHSALSATGLAADPETLVAQLSGGEWTRACVASVLFRTPDFLILDEPTNNLDSEGRAAIARLLSNWHSGAIVVSHDRELLRHVDSVVELSTLGAKRYGGNWDFYERQKIVEQHAIEQKLAHAEKTAAELDRRTRVAHERSERHAAGGARRSARGDLPRLVMGKRRDDSEASRGGATRQMLRLKHRSDEDLRSARSATEFVRDFSVAIPSTGLPSDKRILSIDNVTAGYGSNVVFRDFSFSVVGPERIAIVGKNGTGKTTLLKLISGGIAPLSGHALVSIDFAVLDQHMSFLDRQASILDNFHRMNPQAADNECRAKLASFSFRGDAALQAVGKLSGGEMLRAGLACIFGGAIPPGLLILDEPTNHLDIDAIRSVEAALANYDGSIIVASHDAAFLRNIRIKREIAIRC